MSDHRVPELIMQLRQAGVTDIRVLSALERTPREKFVEAGMEDEAYANRALPIACGQTISQPLVVGLMTQALELGDRHKILEIGTGSGYQAAVVARLCRRVYSIERHRDLHIQAEERFKALGLHNVTTKLGDGWRGWPEQAPFDRIIVTAAAPEIPTALQDQLADGGIMVMPLGREYEDQELVKVTKSGRDLDVRKLIPVRFVPMVHGVAPTARS